MSEYEIMKCATAVKWDNNKPQSVLAKLTEMTQMYWNELSILHNFPWAWICVIICTLIYTEAWCTYMLFW